jgi:tetratricopeptide (TPR) repeat protein
MRVFALPLLIASAAAALGQSSMPQSSMPQPSMPMNAGPMPAASSAPMPAGTSAEQLGSVSFPVSCAPQVQAPFNRGVALLHNFWYAEAQPQFERMAKDDPGCAMAHWGIAMSVFQQIWDRPGSDSMKLGWEEMKKAQSLRAKTAREQDYIGALAIFYKPGKQDFMARVTAYSAAMSALYRKYPGDVDAGAFYALSLLASEAPDDTSLSHEREAMAVLAPLFVTYPDNPGVVHYIIHACDNPAMAKDGLAAAEHYGQIAPSGPHAAHMPGHIFARLGMWQPDIESQLASIRASEAAEANHETGIMDEPHSYDFLMYAYLQSGQDASAHAVLQKSAAVIDRFAAMTTGPGDHKGGMAGMTGYYRTKFPVFYALEMRDWPAAAALEPVAGAPPEDASLTWWARAIADGHLHRAEQAQADLVHYDALMAEVKKGPHAYYADSTGAQIERNEIAAWASFAGVSPGSASGQSEEALKHMRDAADLQDKVGQGEVDIPAREMLADMLLELHQPQQALAEYRVALRLSPNRLNGLYNAGVAAEQSGDKAAAEAYFAQLLKSTGNGAQSARPELAHAKSFVTSGSLAASQGGGF